MNNKWSYYLYPHAKSHNVNWEYVVWICWNIIITWNSIFLKFYFLNNFVQLWNNLKHYHPIILQNKTSQIIMSNNNKGTIVEKKHTNTIIFFFKIIIRQYIRTGLKQRFSEQLLNKKLDMRSCNKKITIFKRKIQQLKK